MNYHGLRTTSWLRRLAGFVLVSWVLVVVATECGVPCLDAPAPTSPHAHASSLVHQFADVVDHPHADGGSMAHAQLNLTAGALPRVTTLAMALGLAFVVALALGGWGTAVGVSMRGPPRRGPSVLSGRAILTRFCVIRS